MARLVNLEKYYPNIMKDIREFQKISEVENAELNELWSSIDAVFKDEFISDITENGATRWEKMLKLYPKVTDTLELRRSRILFKINSILPYTHKKLQQMFDGMYGVEKIKVVSDKYNNYEIWLNLSNELLLKSGEIRKFTRIIIPANLAIKASHTIDINQGLFYGGIIRQTKHLSIYPIGSFSAEIPSTNYQASGIVRQAKHYIIRS